MKNNIVITTACFFVICVLISSCSPKQEYQLGIQVPIGTQHVSEDTPYLVSGVYEDSPAYKAGLRPDDIIQQVDGMDLKGLRCDYVYNKLLLGKKGTDVTIVVDRKGEKMIFVVKRGG